MNLLSRNTTTFDTDIDLDIKLPEKAELYLSNGLPQVFKRVVSVKDDHFENSWLYLPLKDIHDIEESQKNDIYDQPSCILIDNIITVDNFYLCPICLDGNCVGFIVYDANTNVRLNNKYELSILKSIELYLHKNYDTDITLNFKNVISKLSETDISLDDFNKRMLKLFSSFVSKSCCGLYSLNDQNYKLRVVVGDIEKFDSIPGKLTAEQVEKYKNLKNEQNHFIPAEIEPNHISFLSRPPEMLYVRPVIRSKKNSYLLKMTLSGDITHPAMTNIIQLGDFAAELKDTKFLNSRELLKIYESFERSYFDKPEQNRFYCQLFKLLDRYLNLKKLIYVDKDFSARIYERTFDNSIDYCHVANSSQLVERDIIFDDEGFCHKTSPADSEESISKLYCCIPLFDEKQAVLALTVNDKNENYSEIKPFLKGIIKFIKHKVSQGYSNYHNESHHTKRPPLNEMILRRFNTIRKLTGGYYHNIFNTISVIVGQGEVLSAHALNKNKKLVGEKVAGDLLKITRAADDITLYLNMILGISDLTRDDFEQQISSVKFINRLTKMMHGYSREIQDSKNIILKVTADTKTSHDFKVNLAELYDYFLPLLIGLFDSCGKSGVFRVRTDYREKHNRIIIEFDPQMLSILSARRLFSSIYGYSGMESVRERNGNYEIGDICLSVDSDNGNNNEIIFKKKNKLEAVEYNEALIGTFGD